MYHRFGRNKNGCENRRFFKPLSTDEYIYIYIYPLTADSRSTFFDVDSKRLRYYFCGTLASFWRDSSSSQPITPLYEWPRYRNAIICLANREIAVPAPRPDSTLRARAGGGEGGFPSPVQRRVIVRLTPLTLCHHYDVNERQVSILASVDLFVISRGQKYHRVRSPIPAKAGKSFRVER